MSAVALAKVEALAKVDVASSKNYPHFLIFLSQNFKNYQIYTDAGTAPVHDSCEIRSCRIRFRSSSSSSSSISIEEYTFFIFSHQRISTHKNFAKVKIKNIRFTE
jgi:hypothetical protein